MTEKGNSMKRLKGKKPLASAALLALLAAPLGALAQSEIWYLPQYADGQSGSLSWEDVKWSTSSSTSGPWVESSEIPGIDTLPGDDKVFVYYGTSLGPVSGLIIDEGLDVTITGIVPRFETLRTTEFVLQGTLTLTGKTQSDVGIDFSDTHAAAFSVTSGGKLIIEDATGTFGVSSGSVSSVNIDGGTASLNSNNGNIAFNGISADNSAQIEVKTSVVEGEAESSTGGNATLSNATISGNSAAGVTASLGNANASNIELDSSSLTLKSLQSKTEEVEGVQTTTYYNVTLDTLNASGASKVSLRD